MSGDVGGSSHDFDVFGGAVGCSLVCGALSVVFPPLMMGTATLAALAVAGWASLERHRREFRPESTSRRISLALALGTLLAGTGEFVASPFALARFRALVLAGTLLPLFLYEQRHWTPATRGSSGP